MPDQQQLTGAAAAPRPAGGTRLQLLAMAVAGSVLWHGLLLAPWALMLGIGALWYGSRWFMGLAAAALLFLAWLMSPNRELAGKILQRSQAPGLFAEIDRLRAEAGAPVIHDVLLDDALNAGATTLGRSWWPGGARRVLIIGLPLLAGLPEAEVSAVLAHELGHFSSKHDALGQWLYRTRLLWLSQAGIVSRKDALLDQFATRFANWFAPRFSRLAMQHSRRCEYEADAVAARAAGSEALVKALLRLQVLAGRDEDWHRRELPARQLAQAELPATAFLERWGEFGAVAATADETEPAWRRKPGADDSHPSVRQRAQALGLMDVPPGLPGRDLTHAAGAVLLGEQWLPLLTEWSATRRQEMAREWRADHLHVTAQRHCLEALADEPSVTRARLLAALGHVEQAEAMLAGLDRAGSADSALRYAVAMAELESADGPSPLATAALESLLKFDPAYAVPVREALKAHAQRLGDAEMAERQDRLALRALRRRAQALDAAMRQLESRQLAAPRMPAEALLAFDSQCESDDFVRACWLGHCQATSVDGRVFCVHAIVLKVDAERMSARQLDEDSLLQTYLRQLRRWREGPQQPVLARVVFLAENALPEILNASAARRWVREDVVAG